MLIWINPSIVFVVYGCPYDWQFCHGHTSILMDKKDWVASLNYVSIWGGGGVANCLCYYICLCIKLAYGRGRESQKLTKFCLRSLWMPPNSIKGMGVQYWLKYVNKQLFVHNLKGHISNTIHIVPMCIFCMLVSCQLTVLLKLLIKAFMYRS